MKLVAATILLACAVAVGAESEPYDDDYYHYYSCHEQLWSHLDSSLCLVVDGKGRHSDVYLGEHCTNICPPDEDGLMHIDGTYLCLQAGNGENIKSGRKMRAYPCDKHNKLQQFTSDYYYPSGSYDDDHHPHPHSHDGSYDDDHHHHPHSHDGSYAASHGKGKGGKGSGKGKGHHHSHSHYDSYVDGSYDGHYEHRDLHDYSYEDEDYSYEDDDYHHHHGGHVVLKLKHDHYHHSFCAANRGQYVNEGDPIIFKKCHSVYPEERKYFYFD